MEPTTGLGGFRNRNIHTDYKTGDQLLIVHQSAFAESYPEQTRAYFIVKIGSGTEGDIPQTAMDVLLVTGNYSISSVSDGIQTTNSSVQVLETISDTQESSYRVGAALPGTDFSSMGQVLADEITQEWNAFDSLTEEQRLTSSKLWGMVGIQVEEWSECEETIGFAVNNPLESIDWLNATGYFGMESADPYAEVKHILINANTAQSPTNVDRKLNEIRISSGYNSGKVKITLTANLCATSGTHTSGSVTSGYATYEQKTVNTGSGIPVLIVTTDETNNTGYYNGDYFDPTAYWVQDNVFYTLRVFGNETDKAEIQATLDRILKEI